MKSVKDRFWNKVQKTKTCWLWVGCTSKDYGLFYFDKKIRPTHRISYEWAKGPIPNGYQIDHLCRVRNCVNPEHLEAVTPQINQLRGFSLSGLNHRKTKCPRGHVLEGNNLTNSFIKIGKRDCRICRNKRKLNKRRQNGIMPKGTSTYCSKGHKYTIDNTRITKNGWKVCRNCHREWMKQQRRSRKV